MAVGLGFRWSSRFCSGLEAFSNRILLAEDDVIAEQFERDKNALKACIGLPLERQGQGKYRNGGRSWLSLEFEVCSGLETFSNRILLAEDDVIAEQFERDKNVLKACIGFTLERQGQ